MYVSKFTSPVIDDDFEVEVTIDENGDELTCGYIPRDHVADPNNPAEFCSPLPPDFIIPRSDWPAIIEEQETNEATLVDVRRRAGIKTLSQNGTNYCWYFGSCAAHRIVYASQTGEFLNLCPTAGAAQIKGFRNRGGNTFDAIPWMSKHGTPTVDFWPLNEIDRKHVTPEMEANALEHRLTDWYELPSNNFDAAASCLLRGIPVILGLAWWSHMVCGLALRLLSDGRYGIEIENSHGESYGEKGLAVLTEKKATAFDQAAPHVVTA